VACIEDETVFGRIRDYFTTETPVVPAKTEEMQEADQKGMEERVAETKKAREEAKVKAKADAKAQAKADAEDKAKRDLLAAMKAAKAPANQTSIFDFTE